MRANREWLSIADMMAGLMMVFLFIAVVFMQKVNEDKQSLIEIAEAYAISKSKLNQALHEEFDKDLVTWGAEILPDNTIRFKEPDVLFGRGESKIRKRFVDILKDFFPRYISILAGDEFIQDIIEVRIEGHTSSIWQAGATVETAYLNNAWLSQRRAFSVLDYIFRMPESAAHQEWLIKVLRANGLAFAKLHLENGVENQEKSRRVEFRVITNTEERIEKILEKSKE